MNRKFSILAIVGFAALIVLGTTNVPGGRVGVTEEGGDLKLLESGIHVQPRWKDVALYPVEPSQAKVAARPLTPAGQIEADVRLTISVGRDDVMRLHRTYSGEYEARLLAPLVEDAMSRSGATQAGAAAEAIAAAVAPAVAAYGITLHSVEVASIETAASPEDRRVADFAATQGTKVVILGVDAMDWEIYEDVKRDIAMPNIERLRAEGATGDLLSMDPPVSPMIWTTIATGVDPESHGIIDFLMKDPRTGEDVPITSTMRKVPAIWNIATRYGLTSGFIGWLGSYPAEAVNGFQVSDRLVFHTFDPRWRRGDTVGHGPGDLAGLTYPEELVGEIRASILTQEDIRYETMRRYIRLEPDEMPAAGETFDALDPVANLAHIIASNTTYERVAAYTYEKYRPDILAVYLDMVDAVCHVFIKHMRPRTPDVTDEEAMKYGTAIAATYSHTDSLIGEWLDRIDDETTLIVVSDHGFKHGDLRPSGPSAVGGGQAVKWHRLVGAISFYGKHVKPGATIHGASVRDVCPTVLRLLGLPVAEDMTGRVLEDAFDETWLESAEGAGEVDTYGTRSASGAAVRRGEEEDAILRRLQALGYVSGGDAGEATDYSKLAGSYFAKGEFEKAIDIWAAIVEEEPERVDLITAIANAQLQNGDLGAAEETARSAMSIDPGFHAAHNILTLVYINTGRLDEAEQLASYVTARDPENAEAHFNLGVIYDAKGLNSYALSAFSRSVKLRGDYDESRINLANAYIKAGRLTEAREHLDAALDINPRSAHAWHLIGNICRAEGDNAGALEAYREALGNAPYYAPPRVGAAIVHSRAGSLAEAKKVLEDGVVYGEDLPLIYTNLGIVNRNLGDEREAEKSFKKALEAEPAYVPARLDLARLYLAQGKQDEARAQAENVIRLDPNNAQARAILANLR